MTGRPRRDRRRVRRHLRNLERQRAVLELPEEPWSPAAVPMAEKVAGFHANRERLHRAWGLRWIDEEGS